MTVPPEIRRLYADPIALGEALGYKGDGKGRKVFGQLHRDIMDHAQSQSWTFTVVPRGHAKSTLLSVILPIWKLIRDPDRRILTASATLDLAKKMIGEVRDRINGSLELRPGLFVPFREVFPHAALAKGDSRGTGPTAKLNVQGRTAAGGREPSIFAGAVTSNLAGNHPTDAHFDDLCNEQNSRTFGQRQKVIEFLQQAVPLMRYADAPITVIGTPWAFGDLVDYLEKHPSWSGMRFGVWDGPEGSALCPAFLNDSEIKKIQADVSKTFFAAQYLCSPIPSEEALFEPPLMEAATCPDYDPEAPPFKGAPEILLWDPVHRIDGPAQRSHSLNGLVTVRPVPAGELGLKGYRPDRNIFYVTEAHEVRGGLDEAVQFVEEFIKRRRDHGPAPIKALWIEKEACQAALRPWLQERKRIESTRIRMQPIKSIALDYRLMAIVTALRKGLVRFPKSFPGKDLFFRRLLEFPLSDSDDLPAAISLLSSHLDRHGSLPDLEDTDKGSLDYGITVWK